ncbi:MAG: hypothetical protein ACOH2F_03680 [Cellulomonas sp.]
MKIYPSRLHLPGLRARVDALPECVEALYELLGGENPSTSLEFPAGMSREDQTLAVVVMPNSELVRTDRGTGSPG